MITSFLNKNPTTTSDSWILCSGYVIHLNHILAFFFISTFANFPSAATSAFTSSAVGSGIFIFLLVSSLLFVCNDNKKTANELLQMLSLL